MTGELDNKRQARSTQGADGGATRTRRSAVARFLERTSGRYAAGRQAHNSRAGQRGEAMVEKMRKSATKPVGEKFAPPTKFSPEIGRDTDLRRDFAALILQFPDKVLADSADCSPGTVKCWKAERSFPHGRHLMKLVADFPKIRAWHDRRTGGVSNPQSQVELFAFLEKVMTSDTAEGRAMRARLQQIISEADRG